MPHGYRWHRVWTHVYQIEAGTRIRGTIKVLCSEVAYGGSHDLSDELRRDNIEGKQGLMH